jgi:hypothetical protein
VGQARQRNEGARARFQRQAPQALYSVLSAVKDKFGNRFKLVDAICEIEKRSKDEGFKKRLLDYPVPRLYDMYRASARRAGIAVPSAAPQARAAAKSEASTAEAPKAKDSAKAAPAKPAKAEAAKKPAPAKAPAKEKAAPKKKS